MTNVCMICMSKYVIRSYARWQHIILQVLLPLGFLEVLIKKINIQVQLHRIFSRFSVQIDLQMFIKSSSFTETRLMTRCAISSYVQVFKNFSMPRLVW